ncbi:MAG: hypothetical protein IJX44_09675 [Bacteroidaceae bacterium]|nr:hypothetical protein [Bacteroidaceae bacterium]MBQ8190296.1 hypothetical protein [Bacteroidaceae bacterium]MBQ8362191.1 hypothetical protein [Bacteroidaceae bacterium]MBQ8807420.1 hypothetical protein [Bacteroidaceae bacterium]
MTFSTIVWGGIITIIIVASIFRAIEKYHLSKNFQKRNIHLIEMDKEEDLSYHPKHQRIKTKYASVREQI